MISKDDLFDIIMEIIPQYYKSELGIGEKVSINIDGDIHVFNAFRKNTPNLNRLVEFIETNCDKFLSIDLNSKSIEKQLIQRHIVNEWIKIKGYDGDWFEFFDYCDTIENKTYENSSIGFNFIYNPNEVVDSISVLKEAKKQKILDVLTESQYTYFKMGKDWKFIAYEHIHLSDIYNGDEEYKLIPEFLYPYKHILGNEECGITRTKRGDLIIFNKEGIIASNRKSSWKIYEPLTFKNALVDIFESSGCPHYRIACNMVDIVFDLSYRRHGALIIFDLDETFNDKIQNQHSILDGTDNILYSALESSISLINLNTKFNKDIRKSLILELSSVDGAIVFNKSGKVKSFGSIVKNHINANMQEGARSTAAVSAYNYGMSPVFKISSDGEIQILFSHRCKISNRIEDRQISFL